METNATSLNASAEAEMSLLCHPDVRYVALMTQFRKCNVK